MSIGSHVLRALFVVLALIVAGVTLVTLLSDIEVQSPAKDSNRPYSCGSVFSPDLTNFGDTAAGSECEQARTARATGAVALAGIGVALSVGSAAVSIGGRHRLSLTQVGLPGQSVAAGSGYRPPGT